MCSMISIQDSAVPPGRKLDLGLLIVSSGGVFSISGPCGGHFPNYFPNPLIHLKYASILLFSIILTSNILTGSAPDPKCLIFLGEYSSDQFATYVHTHQYLTNFLIEIFCTSIRRPPIQSFRIG